MRNVLLKKRTETGEGETNDSRLVFRNIFADFASSSRVLLLAIVKCSIKEKKNDYWKKKTNPVVDVDKLIRFQHNLLESHYLQNFGDGRVDE